MTEHEVMRGVADLCTIKQLADVMGISMGTPFFQAVVDGVDAGIVAVFASVNALVMFRVLVFVDVRHMAWFV